MKKVISQALLNQPTLTLAPKLLGVQLNTKVNGKHCAGIIVEVEAYHGETDPSCHCFYGRTARNDVMFWSAGHCYVYTIYGMHLCVNIVTEKDGIGAAILIRALEPLIGISCMMKRRKVLNVHELCNGPAKLCAAMGIKKSMWGEHMLKSSRIWLSPGNIVFKDSIKCSTRIGITKGVDLPWRFYIKNNPYVSRRS